jgi:hypothetical protein
MNDNRIDAHNKATKTNDADIISFSGCKDDQTSADLGSSGIFILHCDLKNFHPKIKRHCLGRSYEFSSTQSIESISRSIIVQFIIEWN